MRTPCCARLWPLRQGPAFLATEPLNGESLSTVLTQTPRCMAQRESLEVVRQTRRPSKLRNRRVAKATTPKAEPAKFRVGVPSPSTLLEPDQPPYALMDGRLRRAARRIARQSNLLLLVRTLAPSHPDLTPFVSQLLRQLRKTLASAAPTRNRKRGTIRPHGGCRIERSHRSTLSFRLPPPDEGSIDGEALAFGTLRHLIKIREHEPKLTLANRSIPDSDDDTLAPTLPARAT